MSTNQRLLCHSTFHAVFTCYVQMLLKELVERGVVQMQNKYVRLIILLNSI